MSNQFSSQLPSATWQLNANGVWKPILKSTQTKTKCKALAQLICKDLLEENGENWWKLGKWDGRNNDIQTPPDCPLLPAKSHEGLFQIEYKGWADYFLVALCPLNFSRNLSYI